MKSSAGRALTAAIGAAVAVATAGAFAAGLLARPARRGAAAQTYRATRPTTGASCSSASATDWLRRVRPPRRRPAVGARLSARRHPLHQDPQRDHLRPAAHRRIEHPRPRRSGAVQLPDRLHGRAGVLVDSTTRKRENFRSLPEEGGLRDLRRLPRPRGTGTTCSSRCAGCCPSAWIQIDDGKHPVWHSFFEINDLQVLTSLPRLCRR